MILKEVKWLSFKVIGKWAPHHAPYIISLKINDVENCYEPHRTYFSLFEFLGVTKFFEAPDQLCGRRKIDRKYTELIVNGSPTKYGDWPWHAAIYRYRKASLKYICGGTLITKVLVLTAARCATIRGETVIPESLGVVLGKYTLYSIDIAVQSKEVFQVIVHDAYNHSTHANDIAQLMLRTQATFNNLVQPACLWFDGVYDQIGTHKLTGTI
nr:vitamin K-dependent protein C-like [Danaus plexippus plexippus]